MRASSVFTSQSGEWKLGGFDVLSSMNDEDAVIYVSYSWAEREAGYAENYADIRQPCSRFSPL